jgi:hypothetical protein
LRGTKAGLVLAAITLLAAAIGTVMGAVIGGNLGLVIALMVPVGTLCLAGLLLLRRH